MLKKPKLTKARLFLSVLLLLIGFLGFITLTNTSSTGIVQAAAAYPPVNPTDPVDPPAPPGGYVPPSPLPPDRTDEDRERDRENREAAAEEEGVTLGTCEDTENLEFNWFWCPMLRVADRTLNFLEGTLNNFLAMPTGYFQGEAGDALQQAWSRFRNIGFALLIPIFLIMIISTALGFEFISAYTLKKAMPKMVFAVIFMAISYPLLVEFIFIVNEIGAGVAGIIYFAFGADSAITLAELVKLDTIPDVPGNGVFEGLFFAVTVIGVISLLGILMPLLLFGLAMLLGFLTIVILLAAREMLIILLLVLAPIAIIAWIFPASNKLWNVWKDSFFKLVLLYPLIMLLVAGGRSFAQIASATRFDPAVESSFMIGLMLILTGYIAPFFFIPSAMKMGGAAFGAVSGVALNKMRGSQGTLKKMRGNAYKKKLGQRGEQIKKEGIFREAPKGSLRSGVNKATKGAIAFGAGYGVNPARRIRQTRAQLSKSAQANIDEALEKNEDVKAISANEEKATAAREYAKAGGGSKGRKAIKEYLRDNLKLEGAELTKQTEAVMDAVKGIGTADEVAKAAPVMMVGTKTAYAKGTDGAIEMLGDLKSAYGDDDLNGHRALMTIRGLAERANRPELALGGASSAIKAYKAIDFRDKRNADGTYVMEDGKRVKEAYLRPDDLNELDKNIRSETKVDEIVQARKAGIQSWIYGTGAAKFAKEEDMPIKNGKRRRVDFNGNDLGGMRGELLTNAAKMMQNPRDREARTNYAQSAAKLMTAYERLPGTSPEKAQVFAELFGEDISTTGVAGLDQDKYKGMSVRDFIESNDSMEEYQDLRKVYYPESEKLSADPRSRGRAIVDEGTLAYKGGEVKDFPPVATNTGQTGGTADAGNTGAPGRGSNGSETGGGSGVSGEGRNPSAGSDTAAPTTDQPATQLARVKIQLQLLTQRLLIPDKIQLP
jgi:hypothetical protein